MFSATQNAKVDLSSTLFTQTNTAMLNPNTTVCRDFAQALKQHNDSSKHTF